MLCCMVCLVVAVGSEPCSSVAQYAACWIVCQKEHSSASDATAAVGPDSSWVLAQSLPAGARQRSAKTTAKVLSHTRGFQTTMIRGECLGVFHLFLFCSITGLLMEQHRDAERDQELNKAILEMLHIKKVSASHQTRPHPYMRMIYLQLALLDPPDLRGSDGILVQSFKSVDGKN